MPSSAGRDGDGRPAESPVPVPVSGQRVSRYPPPAGIKLATPAVPAASPISHGDLVNFRVLGLPCPTELFDAVLNAHHTVYGALASG